MRRMLTLLLALALSTGFLAVAHDRALAWNGSTFVDGYQACGANEWCGVNYYVGGGSDSWDYIRIDYRKTCYGSASTASWEGGVNRGSATAWFWNGAGCYSVYAVIYWYDNIYGPNCWIGPLS
jgi:hypothetical protein